MQNLTAIADELVRQYSQTGSSWWMPAMIAGIVFLAATWSIGKQVRAVLGGK